jgi:hypothetical protein
MLEREMFEAYVKQADAVTFGGKPLLTWDELGEDSQICWKAAASVCADEIERLREALKLERQLKDDALRAFNEAQAALKEGE